MEAINLALSSILDFLHNNQASIGSILAIIYVVICKVVSNEQAGAVVSKLQVALDLVAGLFVKLGDVLHAISDFLASLIKSDGFLGKK